MRSRLLTRLRRNAKGSALVEFAFISPVIIMVIVGAMQVSMLLYANATMRSALGEGARLATVYRSQSGTWYGPPATEICQKVEDAVNSFQNAEITALTLTKVTSGAAPSLAHGVELDVSYNVDLDWVFFTSSPTLSATRRVYVRSEPNFGATAFSCP